MNDRQTPRDAKKRCQLLELAAYEKFLRELAQIQINTTTTTTTVWFGYICCCSDNVVSGISMWYFFLACGGILRCRPQANKSPKADATSKHDESRKSRKKKVTTGYCTKGIVAKKRNKRWHKKWIKLTKTPMKVSLTARK